MISNLEQLQVIWFTISSLIGKLIPNLEIRVKFILVILTLPFTTLAYGYHFAIMIEIMQFLIYLVLQIMGYPQHHTSASSEVYIPPNMVKSILPMFYIDNIDWQEDTPDGKNTSHYLLLCVFQHDNGEHVPLTLDVDQKNTSLILGVHICFCI